MKMKEYGVSAYVCVAVVFTCVFVSRHKTLHVQMCL